MKQPFLFFVWICFLFASCPQMSLFAKEAASSSHMGFSGLKVTTTEECVAINKELVSQAVLALLENELKLEGGTLDSQSLKVELTVGGLGHPDDLVSVSFYTHLYDHAELLNEVSSRLMGYALARLRGYGRKYAQECLNIPVDTPIQVKHIKDFYPYVNLRRLKPLAPPIKKGGLLQMEYELEDEHSRVFRYYVRWEESGEPAGVGEIEMEKKEE